VELLEAKRLNRIDAEIAINKFISMSFDDLKIFVNDPSHSVHELLIARILVEAIRTGDHMKLEWVYYRLFGKIKEVVSVEGQVSKEEILKKWANIDPKEHIALLKAPIKDVT